MRGVKARMGGLAFLRTGVVKRQHSTLRRLRGRVRTGTGHEPFISPERSFGCFDSALPWRSARPLVTWLS
jgi:hypothetical protein